MAFSSLMFNSACAMLLAFFIAAFFSHLIDDIEWREQQLGADLQINSPWQRFKILYKVYFYFGLMFIGVAMWLTLQGPKRYRLSACILDFTQY